MPTSLKQTGELQSLGHKPLIVVTAHKDAQIRWMPLQNEMASLSANSLHRVILDATHASLTEDKGDAAVSTQAILDVVKSVRSAQPLTK